MRIAPALLLAALLPAAFTARPARGQVPLANPGFEEGAPALAGWRFVPSARYTAALDSVGAHEGRWAARVTGRPGGGDEFGNVRQQLDAAPFRGKRLRFRAWVRTDLPAGSANHARLWFRVDRPGGSAGFFDNMGARPVVGRTGWQAYEITGDVAPDAESILLGLLLIGAGEAWIDAVSLELVGDVLPPEPARALAGRGLENVTAFSRLLGYVRYFHPSDQAASTDWGAFAAAGVRAVEGAPDAARLAAVLDSLFRPVAPTLVVHAGEPAAARAARPPEGPRVVSWRHYGVGLGAPPYASGRIHTPAAGPLPDSVPDPRQPLRVRLGGGVSAAVPLAVYADSAGTLPRVGPPPAPARGPSASGADRATRLADVALAWNVFQHFYPYFDVVDADWPAELPRALRAAADDADECAFLRTLRRMVAALDDGHGQVHHACEGGRRLPPVAVESVEGRPTVVAVEPGVEGVRPGDVVLAVEGRPAEALVTEQGERVSSATPQWRRYMANAMLLSGRDSVVRVTVERAGGDTAEVTLRRSALREVTAGRPEPVAQLRPGIWYVDLDRVTTAQLQAALPDLEHASGLVFDLRGYPDGLNPMVLFAALIREPAASARWEIPVATRPDRQGVRWDARARWDLRPGATYLAAPRVFITDGRAISYAESVMGIVEAYRLGEIVGEPTAGTNGNVNPLQLPGGYSVIWTGMRVLKHDGSRHHGVGIHPTVPARRTRAGVAAGRDELLERALDVVARPGAPRP